MYLEYKKKIRVLREMLERMLVDEGEYPDKAYINHLLDDMDTRFAIFSYENVQADTKLDVHKMNKDLYIIRKDLEILYKIITELSSRMYKELESYVNGYLLTLESIADEADARAREDLESTSLGAKTIYFTDKVQTMSFADGCATIPIGDVVCKAGSKLYTTIQGTGFTEHQAVFDIGGKQLLPYSVGRDMMRAGGMVKKVSYTYSLPNNAVYGSAFRIANSNIKVDRSHKYDAYGGADQMELTTPTENRLVKFYNNASYEAGDATQYSFYLTNATHIRFDFSNAPTKRNFYEDDVRGLLRDKMYHYEFTMPKGASFRIDMDGILYATKEPLSVKEDSIYVTQHTKAKDFLINEYEPAEDITFHNVSVKIMDVEEGGFHIESIAIKEIYDTEVASE